LFKPAEIGPVPCDGFGLHRLAFAHLQGGFFSAYSIPAATWVIYWPHDSFRSGHLSSPPPTTIFEDQDFVVAPSIYATTASCMNFEVHSLAVCRSSFDLPFNSSQPSSYFANFASPHEAMGCQIL
jgi:hypothetical protein